MLGLGSYPWVVLALAAQRLEELRLSARRQRGVAGEVAAPRWFPAMVLTHAALFIVPSVEARLCQRRPRHRAAWLAALLGATALRRWCIASLGEAWNVRALVPDPLPVSERGPYRYVRHPNYLAVAVEFLALPMAGGAWASAVGLSLANLVVLVPRIRAEERLLARDPGYRERFSGRARFIPGIF